MQAELGLLLRRQGSAGATPLRSVLNAWGTGEERPAGNLTVEERQALLTVTPPAAAPRPSPGSSILSILKLTSCSGRG